jgi:pyruvate kinase
MLDTKGPEIRTGFFREDVGKTIDLKAGQQLILTTDYSFKGETTLETSGEDVKIHSKRV